MKLRGTALLLLSIAPLLIGGCSTYGYKTPLGENTYPPVDYHKVKLLFAPPNRPYDVIGVVSTQGGVFATPGDMYQKLLKSAAALGADAVIVTGEGSNKAILPGTTTTVGTANTTGSATATDYGNTVDVSGNANTTATATTYSSPTVVADMPTNKGWAIKFKQEPNSTQ